MTLESRRELEALRPARTQVNPSRPNAAWVEREPVCSGQTVGCLTILLAVNECPWRCVMCDLWRQTLTRPTRPGEIPAQIRWALEHLDHELADVRWVKLYNSGSFFDPHSVPPADWEAIGALTERFDRVIVENHPRLCNERVVEFRRLVRGELEIALGVESVQPGMLRRLQKGMHRGHVDHALTWLAERGILSRAFLMQRPPWNQEQEAIRWTLLSVRHLSAMGTQCISIIPARAGNGWMEQQQRLGNFSPPSTASMEEVLRRSLDEVSSQRRPPVVTVDLWDWPPEGACVNCSAVRRENIERMNFSQRSISPTVCAECDSRLEHRL